MKPFKEGDVVVCKGHSGFKDELAQVSGTVAWIHSGELAILDAKGFIHMNKLADVYLDQGV